MPIDYKRYPRDWHQRIRPAVLARAQNKCEFCGAQNYQPHPVTGSRVVLTLAHLDHDEQNPSPSLDRLRALCQRCHLAYDRDDNQRRKKLKAEASGTGHEER